MSLLTVMHTARSFNPGTQVERIESFEKIEMSEVTEIKPFAQHQRGFDVQAFIGAYHIKGNKAIIGPALAHFQEISRRQKEGELEALMRKGANERDPSGNSALHLAIKAGDRGAIIELIANPNVDVNAKNKKGVTPLQSAVSEGDIQTIRALLKAGANVNEKKYGGFTPLHSVAVFEKNIGIGEVLLKADGIRLNEKNRHQATPLHTALKFSNNEFALAIIRAGAEINERDNDKMSPLHYATERANINTIRALIRASADVHAKNSQGRTPLHLAAELGRVEAIVEFLAAGANVDEKDNEGQTPMHLAAQHDDKEGIQTLIEANGDVHARDHKGRTSLHQAAQLGRKAPLKQLMQAGANINPRDHDGKTPRHLARKNRHFSVVKDLAWFNWKKSVRSTYHFLAVYSHGNAPEDMTSLIGATTVFNPEYHTFSEEN